MTSKQGDTMIEVPKEEDLELLAKLEEQNRLLETEAKLKSLTSPPTTTDCSRRSSENSDNSAMASAENAAIGTNGSLGESSDEEILKLWGQVVNDWPNYSKKQKPLIEDLVRKGIPEALRSLIWQLLCNVHNNRVQVREKYVQLLRQTSPCEKVIKRDIPRTFPEHQYFREKGSPGQEGLFNVMKAYSLFDAEVGYCQGSAFVVGQLLLNMPEEDAFTVFQALMYDYRLREMFKPTMAELGLCIYQLECIVQEILPELFNHFQQQNFYTSMYASSWFLTLFSSNLPLHIANRVMDLFLFDGLEIIFRLSIAILQLCRDELLRLDMEGLLKYFQKEMPHKCDIDPDYLIHLAINVKLDQKKMKKLAKDYTTIKQKEQEEMVELRRLRTENRLLRQKIDVLELESGELADKLIQGQVCRAQEAEDNFVIKRELAAAKQSETEQLERITKLEADLEAMRQKQRLSQSLECQEHKELVESLQEELVAVKLRDAENNEEMKCLRERIRQLEEEVAKLRELPADHATARLQDELLASKLREGEALMSIKELKEKIGELQVMWQEHMTAMHPEANAADPSQPSSLENGSKENSLNNNNNNSLNSNSLSNGPTSSSTSTSLSVTSSPMKILNAVKRNFDQPGEINRLKTELMGTKLKEAEAVSDLKETRQRILELETQNTVTMNQIRRQAEEMKRLEEQLEALGERERQANMRLHQEQSRYSDLDFLVKEENMMKRIKELEQTQLVAELRQKISSLETKIEEFNAKSKLSQSGYEPNTAGELQDRMAELQTEMFRLDASNQKLQVMQQNNNNNNNNSSSNSNKNNGHQANA